MWRAAVVQRSQMGTSPEKSLLPMTKRNKKCGRMMQARPNRDNVLGL